MKRIIFLLTSLFLLAGIWHFGLLTSSKIISGAPPYDAGDGNIPQDADFSWLKDWKRPEGPAKVALQVGHWKTNEIPSELHRLRGNTGAAGGGIAEWEVNYEIALLTQKLLEAQEITVEILPATIPPSYWADVFVAIHADGHEDTTKTGFKATTPRRDYTENADELLTFVRKSYEDATELVWDETTITRNMRGYYAFSWWRYEHAVHPMTTSIILETGFLSSPSDREIIVDQPEKSAQGLANGIVEYLKSQNLLET